MFRRLNALSTRPLAGYLVCVLAFVVFQGLLFGLTPFVQREFAAENLDPRLAVYLDPAFLHARLWLGVVLVFLLLTLKFYDFGPAGTAALVVFVVFANVLVVIRALQFPVCTDDAYIDFRAARQLVLQGSLDYNAGDAVMAFTSNLHLWILSLLGWVGGFDALPHWSQCFNISCDLFSFGLVYKLGRQLKLVPGAAVVGSVLLALSSYQALSTTDGKETSLVVLLLLVLIFAVETNRLAWVAWAASLIFLTRPEGVVVATAAGIWGLYAHGRRSLKYWMLPGLLAGLWYALLWHHFGTIWPQGMVAKALVYPRFSAQSIIGAVLAFLAGCFGCNEGSYYQHLTIQGWGFMLLIVPLLLRALWRSPGTRLYLAALALLTMAFVVKKVWLAFSWYFSWYALVPMLVIPILFQWALGLAREAGGFRVLLTAGLVGFVAFIPLGAYSRTHAAFLGSTYPYPYPLFTWNIYERQRLLAYRDLALRVKAEAGATATVAPSEDGVVGYFYNGPILTLDGLAYRGINNYYPLPAGLVVSDYAISPKMIAEQKPDYVILLEVYGRNSLLKDETFTRQYVLEETIPTVAYGSNGMLLYKRKAAPAHQ